MEPIVVLSSPIGYGAISVIRISGDNILQLLSSLFNINILNLKPNIIKRAKIIHNSHLIDDVMFVFFKGPKSFTSEDMIEIYCHGNPLIVEQIITLIKETGIRDAEAGEFTKRAFINKKFNLIQAEAINDLICASNETSLALSKESMQGINSIELIEIKGGLLKALAILEVSIDYPEYSTNTNLFKTIKPLIAKQIKTVKEIYDNTLKMIHIKNGFNISIIGAPNVGKSSLLNSIIGYNKAIVTNIPGTTRDIIEATITHNGYTLNFFDTAGLHDTQDVIELLGIQKIKDLINRCNLNLVLFDHPNQTILLKHPYIKNLDSKKLLLIKSKCDIKTKESILDQYFNISLFDKDSIKLLLNHITKILKDEYSFNSKLYLSNQRQLSLLKECLNNLQNITKTDFIDIIASKLSIALKSILHILGEDFTEELTNEIFSNFCIGK